jgi:hypothetical protein
MPPSPPPQSSPSDTSPAYAAFYEHRSPGAASDQAQATARGRSLAEREGLSADDVQRIVTLAQPERMAPADAAKAYAAAPRYVKVTTPAGRKTCKTWQDETGAIIFGDDAAYRDARADAQRLNTRAPRRVRLVRPRSTVRRARGRASSGRRPVRSRGSRRGPPSGDGDPGEPDPALARGTALPAAKAGA